MHGILEKITAGEATPADVALLEELCELVRSTSLCGLGQNAPNPVVTTLNYFRKEYDAHVTGAGCPAGTCKTSEAVTERAEVTV
jgi:NADH:ubiquinone oxidoreductase subunit F (NADH-binding)